MKRNTLGMWSLCGLLLTPLSALAAGQCNTDQALISKKLYQHHGSAFKIFNESYELAGGFENPAHYRCLYFNDAPVGKVGPVSFSPQGNYIVFNSPEEGSWKLMDLKGKTHHLGAVRSMQHYRGIKWGDGETEVTIVYDKAEDSSTFGLSSDASVVSLMKTGNPGK